MTNDKTMPTSEAGRTIPRALREGTLRFGAIEVPCHVLPGGADILTKRGILRAFAGVKAGNLERFLERIPGDSESIPLGPSIRFRLAENNAVAEGYAGGVLIDICTRYVEALATGALHPKQVPLAARAALIVTACAKTGITALIWEATGYDRMKAGNALQDKLAATLRHDAARWERLFSPEFFTEMAKLFRLKLGADGRRPMAFAGFLAEFFYEWFDDDVYTAVKVQNPRREELGGEREHCHHQFLTAFARERFERHQRDVLILMRASTDLTDFRMRFDAAFRGGGLQLSLGVN